MKHMQMVILVGLSLVLAAGCSNSQKTSKGFAAVMDTWPAPLEAHGRLVFYSLPDRMIVPLQDEEVSSRTYQANISLMSEDYTGRFNIDQYAAGYVDVPEGDYTINVRLAAIELELTVEAGKTYFIKTQIRPDGFCDNPELTDAAAAEKLIRKEQLTGTAPGLPITLIPRTGKALAPAAFNPSDPPASGRCRLVLIRSSGIFGLIMPVHVGLDCPPQVKVRNKQYCVIDAPAGEHILTLAYSPNLAQGLADTYRVGFKVDLPEDSSHYVGFFNINDLSRIKALTKAEAEELMAKSNPAQDATLKVLPPDEERTEDD